MKMCMYAPKLCALILSMQSFFSFTCLVNEIEVQVQTVPISCCGEKGHMAIIASGGFEPYQYSIDNGLTWYDNSEFDVLAGRYDVTVLDAYGCQSQTKLVWLCNKPCSDCIRPETFLLTKKYSHGAPIQSVDFMCDEKCSCVLAAIGGYKSCFTCMDQASIRVYQLDPAKDLLKEIPIDVPAPTDFVYSVDWCCYHGIPYLAVGGCPDQSGTSLWIYKYYDGSLVQVASFVNQGTIFSVAWLCEECSDHPDVRYLAIGGEPVQGADVQLLSFVGSDEQLQSVCRQSHGATIYSLDWCYRANSCPLLVAGGMVVSNCAKEANLRIFNVSCEGDMILAYSGLFDGGTVRSVSWCCDGDKTCPEFEYLLVSGDSLGCSYGANIKILCYDCIHGELAVIAQAQQSEKVFAAKWIPTCACKRFIAGSSCSSDCEPNLVAYDIQSKKMTEIFPRTFSRHDDNITSLSLCKICDVYYILVGSESNDWKNEDVCPFNCNRKIGNELALYKGVFCKNLPCHAKPICKRSAVTN